jgi:hypothetical protein
MKWLTPTLTGAGEGKVEREAGDIKKGSRGWREPIVSFTTIVQDTEMGEEKPEEELMGKRKSSPRLTSIAIRRCCHSLSLPVFFSFILLRSEKFFLGPFCLPFLFVVG